MYYVNSANANTQAVAQPQAGPARFCPFEASRPGKRGSRQKCMSTWKIAVETGERRRWDDPPPPSAERPRESDRTPSPAPQGQLIGRGRECPAFWAGAGNGYQAASTCTCTSRPLSSRYCTARQDIALQLNLVPRCRDIPDSQHQSPTACVRQGELIFPPC